MLGPLHRALNLFQTGSETVMGHDDETVLINRDRQDV